MIALLLSLVLVAQGIPVQAQQSGTVRGVLKDNDGKPVAGIRIAAVAKPQSIEEAATSAAMSSIAETDDQGRYELGNIPPGRYFIAAGRLDSQTYYPGTLDMATAKELAITPGENISGIDFALGNSSFGRANTNGSLGGTSVALPLRVSVEGGGKMPFSGNGKIAMVRLDMAGSVITAPLTGTIVNVPGPQTTAYRVTVENLPETYAVKSMTYGSTDLLTNTLRLTPANFSRPATTVQLARLAQNEQDLFNYLTAMAAARSNMPPPAAPAGQPPTLPTAAPPSLLSITLAPVTPKVASGVRVSGRTSVAGSRTVYLSGIPGAVYSDGTFDVYGVPPGRHVIVTRDNSGGSSPLAASVVVENRDLSGIVLVETAMLPLNSWQPAPPRPTGGHPEGNVALAKLMGTLVEEISRQPIPEGTVILKTNGYYTSSFPVDDHGHFELPPLLPGAYEIEVQIFGHSNIKRFIEIDDQDLKLELSSRKLY